jgi:hypothetical protein
MVPPDVRSPSHTEIIDAAVIELLSLNLLIDKKI